jgi:signal transduction histidine kinase
VTSELDLAESIAESLSLARTHPEACRRALAFLVERVGAKGARIYSLKEGGWVSLASAGDAALPEAPSGADAAWLREALEADAFAVQPSSGLIAAPLVTGEATLGAIALKHADLSAARRSLVVVAAACLAQALVRLEGEVEAERLRGVEAELTEALRQRDEFLSVASHELNTPLTSLQLNLEQLGRKLSRGSALDLASVQRSVERMIRQVHRLGRLLEHLLDLSRLRSQRFHLDIEAFDLCELVRDMSGRLTALADEHGCRLELYCDDTIIGYWDRLRVEQIVSNLVSNAFKYGQRKPVELHAHVEGDTAVIDVVDQGIGIPAADLERIFERFERATALHQSESFGLGLYISRELARAHGGDVTARSQPGRGSTFTLRLPIHSVPQVGQPSPGAST